MNIFKKIQRYFSNLFIQKDGEEEHELQTKTESESKEWRTRRYRRFYEGYTEVMVPKEGGGYRTDMVYTDPYYQPDVSEKGWRLLKLRNWLLVLLSAAFWLPAALMKSAANTTLYVYIPEIAVLLGFLMMLRYLTERSFAPYKMIVREYKDAVKNIRLMSVTLLTALLVSAATVALHILIRLFGAGVDVLDLLQLAAVLLSALCMYILYGKEKSIVYLRIQNPDADIRGHKVR